MNPASEETEKAVLGACLLEPDLILRLDDLGPEHFTDPRHRQLWEAMRAVTAAGKTVDVRHLQDHLERTGLWGAGWHGFLAGLDLDLPDLSAAESYAEILEDRLCRRKLLELAERAKALALSHPSGAELFGKMEEAIRGLDRKRNGRLGRGIGAILAEIAEARKAGRGVMKARWGYRDVDRATGGFQQRTLTLLAGNTGAGKTSLACSIARANAKRGLSGAIYSTEQGRDAYGQKLLSQQSGIPLWKLKLERLGERPLSPTEEEMRRHAAEEMRDWRLVIEDEGSRYVEDIVTWTKRWLAFNGELDLLIVDHLQEARTRARTDRRERFIDIAEVLRDLTRLVPVLLLCQLSEDPTYRAEKVQEKDEEKRKKRLVEAYRPRGTDLADAKAVAHKADYQALLFRPGYYRDTGHPIGETELILGKAREDEQGRILPLLFVPETTDFREPA